MAYGQVTAQLKNVTMPTYDHVAAMLEQALEEVRHRIKNGIRLR